MTKRGRGRCGAAWLLALAMAPGLAVAEVGSASGDTPQVWLQRMAEAGRKLDYQGTYVYQHNRRTEVVDIVHRVSEGLEQERITSVNGAAREVLRHGQEVTCILPENKSVVVGRGHALNPFANALLGTPSGIAEHYKTSFGGEDRIAGLRAREIVITPKDPYRYGYRLWLEQNTGLLLKSELRDGGKEPLEQVMFTRVELGNAIPPEAVAATLNDDEYTWFREDDNDGDDNPARQTVAHSAWKVAWVPTGFAQQMDKEHALAASGGKVEHQVYSDGLAAVSVYVELAPSQAQPGGVSRMGAVHAYDGWVDGHRVTVVGEVPAATVRRIGESVQHRGDGS